MVNKFIAVFAIATSCMILSLSPVIAADDPVCDPSIATMLNNAGKEQAKADIAQIDAIITKPAPIYDISCTEAITTAGATGEKQPCEAIDNMWAASRNNTNTLLTPTATGDASGGTPTASNNGKFDTMNLMLASTAPLSVAKKCHPGIPTGAKINRANEIVCPNPGCYPQYNDAKDIYECKAY